MLATPSITFYTLKPRVLSTWHYMKCKRDPSDPISIPLACHPPQNHKLKGDFAKLASPTCVRQIVH